MHYRLYLWIILACCPTIAQECVSYVFVDAFDRKGKGIDSLAAGDFQAKIVNAPLGIVSASQKFNNRVLLLLETTRADGPKIVDFEQAVADFARSAPEGRLVAFGMFAERSVFTKGFFSSLPQRKIAIDEVMAQAATLGRDAAVYDALHQALALFGPHQPGDTIVLVTVGHDHKSIRNPSDMEKEFASNGTRLLAMLRPRLTPLGQDWRWRSIEERFDFEVLVSKTGGSYVRSVNQHNFEFAWAGYLVGVKVPAKLDKPTLWKLEIHNTSNKTYKDSILYYPEKLIPCSNPVAAVH